MSRTKRNITETDVARDGYPRQVRCRRCGHKFTAWYPIQADSLRAIGCIYCPREKLRGPGRR